MHKVRPEQQVSQADQGHRVQHAEQDAAEEQIAAALGQNGGRAQAGEDRGRSYERRHDDGRIDVDDLLQQQPECVPGEGSEAEQQTQTHVKVLAVVRVEDQAKDEPQSNQSTEHSGLPDALEVDERTDGGRGACCRQTGVHFGQVVTDAGFPGDGGGVGTRLTVRTAG